MANGTLMMVYGTLNYFRVQNSIVKGNFPQNKVGVLGVMMSTSIMSALALYKLADDRRLGQDVVQHAVQHAVQDRQPEPRHRHSQSQRHSTQQECGPERNNGR